ncbi:MAG: histidinol-phosphate transaminase [Termitinemataceae bacterium]|nr:MAG: histidinol-phosphate transaminase [Termitinemataceae bacterium]
MSKCKYWNERTRCLSPYIAGEQPPAERKFIKLNTNENPYPPSPKVAESINRLLREGAGDAGRLRLYPDPACTALRAAIAEKYGVSSDQVFCGNGSDEVLGFAFGAFFAAHSQRSVIMPDVTYSFYQVYAALWDIPIRTIPLRSDFTLDISDYTRSENIVGGCVIANPNAPTGISITSGEIEAIVSAHDKYGEDGIVLVDEAYAAFSGVSSSAVPLIKKYPNLLTVHTLSKAFSLAGLRVGFAIGDKALIEALCRIRDSFNSYTLDALAQEAAAAAIMDSDYYDTINGKIINTKERVSSVLKENDFEVMPSSANFIFIKKSGVGGSSLFTKLREAGILVRYFDKPRISDFVRVTIGSDPDMDTFLQAVLE